MNDILFNELLSIKNEVLIYNENIKVLSEEVDKNFNGLLSTIMLDLLEARNSIYTYNLSNF